LLNLLQKLPIKVVVLSSNGLACIVMHDRFRDPQGYIALGKLHLVIAYPITDAISIEIMKGFAKVVNIARVIHHTIYAVIGLKRVEL